MNTECLKPRLTIDNVKKLLNEAFNIVCIDSIEQLTSYLDQNFKISCNISGHTYHFNFKILNSLDSKNENLIKAEHLLMKTLNKNGIMCPTPVTNINGHEYFKVTENYERSKDSFMSLFTIRLLNFIPGKPIEQIKTYTKELLFNVGKYAANFDTKLKEFYDPVYEHRDCIWHLDKIQNYIYRLESISDKEKKEVLKEVIKNFCTKILSEDTANFLQKGLIHGDFNETNVLVDNDREDCVTGILDFGDASYSYYIFEIAICAVYMMLDSIKKSQVCLNQIESGGYVIAGYLDSFELSKKEFYLILDCIKARLAQSLMNGCYESKKSGDDGYVLITQQSGWNLLCLLQNEGEEKIYKKWDEILYKKGVYLK